MNHTFLQSALREMKIFATSPRLWITFAAVVLLFAITGPYDTSARLPFVPRLGYWLLLHASTWSLAITCVVLADVLLMPVLASMMARMMIGALLASLPIGAAVHVLQYAWFGKAMSLVGYAHEVLQSLPLCAIFCIICFMAMSADLGDSKQTEEDAVQASPEATPPSDMGVPLMARLNPANRGTLLHISVEDHYSMVKTSRGRELILLRFSDALRETGAVDGLQVHRSHWVAKDFVASLNSSEGKLTLTLKDQTEIPVSRTYQDEVRQYFPTLKTRREGQRSPRSRPLV